MIASTNSWLNVFALDLVANLIWGDITNSTMRPVGPCVAVTFIPGRIVNVSEIGSPYFFLKSSLDCAIFMS